MPQPQRRCDRREHEADGEEPDRTRLRLEVAQRREERRRPEDRRKEDEEDEVRIELRDRHARHEPDEEARGDLEDRRRDRKPPRERRERDDERGERDREDDGRELSHVSSKNTCVVRVIGWDRVNRSMGAKARAYPETRHLGARYAKRETHPRAPAMLRTSSQPANSSRTASGSPRVTESSRAEYERWTRAPAPAVGADPGWSQGPNRRVRPRRRTTTRRDYPRRVARLERSRRQAHRSDRGTAPRNHAQRTLERVSPWPHLGLRLTAVRSPTESMAGFRPFRRVFRAGLRLRSDERPAAPSPYCRYRLHACTFDTRAS